MTALPSWRRRAWIQSVLGASAMLACPWSVATPALQRRALRFPDDHGSHPDSRTEWWYLTGWLRDAQDSLLGFQITFFRSRVDTARSLQSRLAARQLLFAHAAVSDVRRQRFHHEQTLTRWNGVVPANPSQPSESVFAERLNTHIRVPGWRLERDANGVYDATLAQGALGMSLRARPGQSLLLQGDAGWSRKGPDEEQASFYYSQPQLQVSGSVSVQGESREVTGRAWLDHEWSEALMHPLAVGWDWIGINLRDGSALTAFRLRKADGRTLWAGGSFRHASHAGREQPTQVFAPDAVSFLADRTWESPRTGIRYPIDWQVRTPAGHFHVRALLDDQELDSRSTTGAIYWEGLVEVRRAGSTEAVGLGYLELTGYGERLRLG